MEFPANMSVAPGPCGRAFAWETTIVEQRADNIHVGSGKTRDERNAQLSMPRLIIASLQVNMRAGDIPRDDTGAPMLKVPVNGL